MEPVIVIRDEYSSDSQWIIEALSGKADEGIYFCSSWESFGSALRDAPLNGHDRITVISASIAKSIDIARILAELEGMGRGFNSFCGSIDPVGIDLSELTIENFIGTITSKALNAPQILSVPASLLARIPDHAQNSLALLSLYLVIQALVSGEEVNGLSGDNAPASPASLLSPADIAGLIRFAISECNIEELFPNHAWTEHEEESLSFCYHTLAALFIRLGDLAGAAECLNISEQFEDSPRLLALRGIVASNEGRTLEAVANMVSSLQQYEMRKKNNGEHYLTFTPHDLETINTELKEGLDALNQRDNNKAYECFSKAIFNFDSFYRDHGIERNTKNS